MRTIESLPERPLTIQEADKLTESGQFVPLGVKQMLPPDEEVPLTDDGVDELLEAALENYVVSLLHAKDEVGVSLAYSEKEGGWVKAVEMPADSYDPEVLEQKTHEFVIRHSDSEIDRDGFVDVEQYK